MQIEIKIDTSCKEPKIIVVTDKITDEINTLAKKLAQDTPQLLTGLQGDILKVLDQHDIIRLYATNGKVYAETEDGEYQLRLRLYELEERLDKDDFVRISNSEIINLKRVKGFDLSYTGTICVFFQNDTVTYVSRRYLNLLKSLFIQIIRTPVSAIGLKVKKLLYRLESYILLFQMELQNIL